MAYPAGYRYTKEHEWIRADGNIGTIGITDHAQEQLGDIVFVELPKPGDRVTTGTSFGTVESVKAVSEIYSPVTGTVKEVNAELANSPELVNKDPHGGAWLIKVEISQPAEVAKLMDAAQYEKFVDEEKGSA